MAVTIRLISDAEEFETLWPKIWPLVDDFEQHHARLLQRELRKNREERARTGIATNLRRGNYWFQVAEEGDQFVGIGSCRILPEGVTEAGPVGYTSYVYVRPELRGTGLAKTLRDQRDDLLRKHGMTIRESSRYSGNGRIAEVWQGSDWGCSWRRPIREHESGREGGSDADDGFAIRRVKDLDAEWPAIWRLLGHAGETDEVAARNRVAGTIEQRGAAYVSGSGEPSGVIVGRVSVNPWLFQERVGVVHNLAVAPDAGEATAAALLERLERWMAAKRATDMQVEPIPHEKGQSWRERGFLPYIHTRRLVL